VRRAEGPVEPRAGSKKRLMIVGGAVGGLLLVLVIVKLAVEATAPPSPASRRRSPTQRRRSSPVDRVAEPTRHRAGQADWARAKVACEKIIELEPIHADANALVRRIQTEKTCEDNLQRGKDLVGVGRLEDAVEPTPRWGPTSETAPRTT